MKRLLALALFASAAMAADTERSLAEWIIRYGGGVTLEGSPEEIRELWALPEGGVSVVAADLTGTLITPEDLPRLAQLRGLRELYLPGPMWNEGAGSRRDSNKDLGALNALASLEKLYFSIHFLTDINIQDKGIEQLAALTNLRELRLQQTKVKGRTLSVFPSLTALDLTYSRFDDEGMASLAHMKNLRRLLVKDTLVSDAGLHHITGLTKLEELDLYGCRVTDAGLAQLSGLTAMK